jgi:hypothetical protein
MKICQPVIIQQEETQKNTNTIKQKENEKI